jgi:hypothetical protein
VWRYERRDYVWLLVADPPLCARGSVVAVLNSCERRRQGQTCICRFNTQEIAEDLTAIGVPSFGDEWLITELEPDDIPDFRDAVQGAVDRAMSRLRNQTSDDLEHAVERVMSLIRRLDRLINNGSGLSGEYADEVDE